MEWLLAHVDELDAAQSAVPAANVADTPAEANASTASASGETAQEPTGNEAATPEGGAAGEAKSLKCDEW